MTHDVKKTFGKRYKDATLSNLRFSKDDCSRLVEWIKKPHHEKRILLILGGPGTGKTYFAAAMVDYLQNQKFNFRYFTDSDFIKNLKMVMQEGHDTKYEIERLSDSADIFILDDVGSIRLTEWEIEQIHCLIDTRYKNQLPLVLISNFTHEQFKDKFEPRLVSRLFASENTVLIIHGDDLRQQGL